MPHTQKPKRSPYSPKLNPSECFNGDLKGEIQRGIPPKGTSQRSNAPCWVTRGASRNPQHGCAPTSGINTSAMPRTVY